MEHERSLAWLVCWACFLAPGDNNDDINQEKRRSYPRNAVDLVLLGVEVRERKDDGEIREID